MNKKISHNRIGTRWWWGFTHNHETNKKDLAFYIDKSHAVIMKAKEENMWGEWVIRNLN